MASCCKVPVKISGFSGGCAKVATLATPTVAISLTAATDGASVGGAALSNLAYLGLKCVNIACPPNLVVGDDLASLAAFLDANLTLVEDYRASSAANLIGATGTTALKVGLAALIAGCTSCCSS